MEWLEAMKEAVKLHGSSSDGKYYSRGYSRSYKPVPFYFQKGFKIITGMTIGAYLRSRRLYLCRAGWCWPEMTGSLIWLTNTVMKLLKASQSLQPFSWGGSHAAEKILTNFRFSAASYKITVEGGSNLNYTVEKWIRCR